MQNEINNNVFQGPFGVEEECTTFDGRWYWAYDIWYIWKQPDGNHLPFEANKSVHLRYQLFLLMPKW